MLGLLTLATPALASASPAAKKNSTGDITKLGLSGITVGHLTCSVPSGMAGVSRFVIGDPVAISCKAGSLESIKYAPAASASVNAAANATPTVAKTVATNPGGNTFTTGSGSTRGTSFQGSGIVTALDASGITVGGVTCPFIGAAAYQVISQHLHLGDSASISCGSVTLGTMVIQSSPSNDWSLGLSGEGR